MILPHCGTPCAAGIHPIASRFCICNTLIHDNVSPRTFSGILGCLDLGHRHVPADVFAAIKDPVDRIVMGMVPPAGARVLIHLLIRTVAGGAVAPSHHLTVRMQGLEPGDLLLRQPPVAHGPEPFQLLQPVQGGQIPDIVVSDVQIPQLRQPRQRGQIRDIVLENLQILQFGLAAEGVDVRVVSMPCMDIFEEQSAEYKASVLPLECRKRVGVEALSSFGWDKYIGLDGKLITMDGFGESAPYSVLFKKYGFTTENIVNTVKSL